MKVLHITPTTDGYEEVTLLANRVNRKNSLAVIEKDGQESMTGGLIFRDSETIRSVFDTIPKENLYHVAREFRITPFVKFYHEED